MSDDFHLVSLVAFNHYTGLLCVGRKLSMIKHPFCMGGLRGSRQPPIISFGPAVPVAGNFCRYPHFTEVKNFFQVFF